MWSWSRFWYLSDDQQFKCNKYLVLKEQGLKAFSRIISSCCVHIWRTVHLSTSVVTLPRTDDWAYLLLSLSHLSIPILSCFLRYRMWNVHNGHLPSLRQDFQIGCGWKWASIQTWSVCMNVLVNRESNHATLIPLCTLQQAASTVQRPSGDRCRCTSTLHLFSGEEGKVQMLRTPIILWT